MPVKLCSSLLADQLTSQSDLEKLENTECEYDSKGEGPQLGSDYHCQKSRRTLYLVSQHLQEVIIGTPGMVGLLQQNTLGIVHRN